MAVYYIDSVNGSDSNDGSSISTAWATLAKAITSGHDVDGADADTTFHLAPGSVFREIIAAGETTKNVGYRCTWIGDRDADVFTSHQPDAIIITNAKDEVTQDNDDEDTFKTSHRNTYKNLDFYGTNGDNTTTPADASALNAGPGNSVPQDSTASHCLIAGERYGVYRGPRLENCISFGYQAVFDTDECVNTIAIGWRGFDTCNYLDSCLAIGGAAGYYNCNAGALTNCTSVGAFYGFENGSGLQRCFAMASYQGFRTNNTSRTVSSSVTYAVDDPFIKGAHYNISASQVGFTSGLQAGDQVTSASAEMFWNYDDLKEIPRYFYPRKKDLGIRNISKYVGFEDSGQGKFKYDIYSSSYSGNEVGSLVQQGNLRFDVTSSAGTAISSSAPAAIFQSYGERILRVPIGSGSAVTASVSVKYTGTVAAAEKPAIQLSYDNWNPHISRPVNTRAITTASENTWEILTVSASAQNIDTVYDLRLQFFTTGSGVEGYFSDLDVR